MTSIEIRVLSPANVADHRAHLLRLDPDARDLSLAGAPDERGVDSHCLRLLAAEAIVIGGIVDGVLRASLKIIPDREREAKAILTCEAAFQSSALVRMLIVRLFDEARSRHFITVLLHGAHETQEIERAAGANGIALTLGAPLELHFGAPLTAGTPSSPAARAYA